MIERTSRKKILLVEDDLSLLYVSKRILQMEASFEIDTASSVNEAFKKINQKTYDFIISDYEMPHKNGLEFLTMLKEQGNQVPFVLLFEEKEVAAQALSQGACACVFKYDSAETIYRELVRIINLSVIT